MSGPRSSADDLAYGDIPQRWDRERFERFGRYGPGAAPPPTRYEDEFRFTERDRGGRRDVTVAERRESSRPGDRREERFYEDSRARSRPRRRTDRELFGEIDPREIAEMALTPYKRTSVTREDIDIDQRSSKPSLIRRQSSLDTFDRRPSRYDRDDYAPVPFSSRHARSERDDFRSLDDDLEDYREVEIKRERSIRRRRPRDRGSSRKEEKEISYHHHHSDGSSSSSTDVEEEEEVKSKAKSRKSSRASTVRAPSTKAPSTKAPSTKAKSTRASSVHESLHETIIEDGSSSSSSPSAPPAPSVRGGFHESAFEESVREERKFKKGKTRMPKRLVRREAIMDLGYPFDEEEDFLVLRIALEKEQIDEVIRISETYRDGEKRKVYKFEDDVEEINNAPQAGDREEIERTEWINPPTVIGSRSRRSSRAPPSPPQPPPPPRAPELYEERKTIVEERVPSHHHTHHNAAVVLAERETRSITDINAELLALERERQALRDERESEQKQDLALRVRGRPEVEYELLHPRSRSRPEVALYERTRSRPREGVAVYERARSRPREEVVLYERELSPSRNVIRIEKDRKERRQARLLAAAMATLT